MTSFNQGEAHGHVTVLLQEVVEHLRPKAGGVYVDVTLGRGGHTEALLERCGPDGVVIGIDRDPNAIENATERLKRFGARIQCVHARASELRDVLSRLEIDAIDGLVADLGVSSPQLDEAERGFSFRREGPLDMRMDPTSGPSARDLIADLDDTELANVIYEYGEERRSRPIARSIHRALDEGKMETTSDLIRAVHRVTGPKRGKIDPATRTFQGLRIAVNRELDELKDLMMSLPHVLREGGRAAIISFHSLEDRIVKHSIRNSNHLIRLHKKPLIASDEERNMNPRSRSAKLRIAERNSEALA